MATAPLEQLTSVRQIERALANLRADPEAQVPYQRTSVATHVAWVPEEWVEAAEDVLTGLADRHPSRTIVLFPRPHDSSGIEAEVAVACHPAGGGRQVCTETIRIRLGGERAEVAWSVVQPLLLPDLPVFLRWRGRPPFGEPAAEQLVDLCDRLIVDSGEWPDAPEAYRELPLERTACSDIAWRRTEPWRRCLAGLWPGIKDARELQAKGPVAEASLLAGWLRSRLEHDVDLVHEAAEQLESVTVGGEPCPLPRERLSGSDLLSAELDEFGRDAVYEAAALAAAGEPG